MIPKECKRLAEVDFPIAVVSKHSAREKSIRHGHPSTLHLWWARRPLAACRAMLMALLLPDPCDPACPAEFIEKARDILLRKHARPTRWTQAVTSPEGLRKTLLEFIGDLANWDNAADMDYLSPARALVKAAHPEETPLVVDPFAGGGSIPLEALRLGCEAFASDLNPVACLINKIMLEDIPRHGPALTAQLRQVGNSIKKKAEKELVELYPKDPDGSVPMAYLWARTIKCESPNCGVEIPLARTFWLCNKANRHWGLKFSPVRSSHGSDSFKWSIVGPNAGECDVSPGTVTGGKAVCPSCGAVIPNKILRKQLQIQNGGGNPYFKNGKRIAGSKLLAIVVLRPGEPGRHYRLPNERDYAIFSGISSDSKYLCSDILPSGLTQIPNEPIIQSKVAKNSPFRFHLYGCATFGGVYTLRQEVLLATFARLIREASESCPSIRNCLAALLSRLSNANNSLCRWNIRGEKIEGMFSRQAVSMVWDFCESCAFSGASGGVDGALEWVINVVENLSAVIPNTGQVELSDASESPLSDESAAIWFTDPPYYDAVSYADLSDFFFAWYKRTFVSHYPRDPFDCNNTLTPKDREAIQDDAKTVGDQKKDKVFFENKMRSAFLEGRRLLQDAGIGSVVFAHKTTEGWEALLTGMVEAGWTITASWPIATEMASRLRARESAALATSIHLVCRPRAAYAPVGDWADVLRKLPSRVGLWMERLQAEGVRGADLVFACIGPALEIYSQFSKVVDPQERKIPLGGDPEATEPYKRGYLAYVWETVGRIALQNILGTEEARARNGMAGALEEDARLTALFLWTLQSTNGQNGSSGNASANDETDDNSGDEADEEEAPKGKTKGYSLVFDVVRRFAQPLGIDLRKWEARIIETRKGVVRLMAISERSRQLFGTDGIETATDWIEENPGKPVQLGLFPESATSDAPQIRGRKRSKITGGIPAEASTHSGATTLDRVHAAMLLQTGGQANALRMLIKSEQERGPDFLRLANALSALYPKGGEEKRLLDAMLLGVPR